MLYLPHNRRNNLTNRAVLMQEIETLPNVCLGEVIDFVAWKKQRKIPSIQSMQIPETMLLSEAVLSKEWNTPEEDKAWENL